MPTIQDPVKLVAKILNPLLLAGAVWGGYSQMEPAGLKHTNPDAILCAILLVLMPVFALGAVQYSLSASGGGETWLRRPSWNRFSINWWHDPLQCLFETNCLIAANALGNAFRPPSANSTGFWTFGTSFSVALGLLIGQLLIYKVHKARIVTDSGLRSELTKQESMRRTSQLNRLLFIFGVTFLMFAYVTFHQQHFNLTVNGRVQQVVRAEHPTAFAAVNLAFLLSGLSLIVGSVYNRLRLKKR